QLEELINKVKISSDAASISNDLALRSILGLVYQEICLASLNKNDEERTGWIKLKAATLGFGGPFFPGFPNKDK
ncbi:MAG: hypothetical protein ACJ749_18260, partial [Flavisolibacter sp.]